MLREDRAEAGPEAGVALITVLGFGLVAMLLVGAAVNFAVNTMPQTRDHEAWNAALAAAEAGVDDLRYRLNQDPFYWATFDEDNDALTGWQDVPGGSGGAQYHYRIDASETTRFGHVDVTVTGRVRDQVRTIDVRMRRDGFLDSIYFTDFETSDPFALTTNAALRTELDERCSVYHPERPRQSINTGGCSDIRFAPADELRGQTRSNDAIMIRPNQGNPRFLGPVLTGWDGEQPDGTYESRLYIRESAPGHSGEPFFRDGIQTVPRMPLPETTASLATHADDSGCLYEGPTYIYFMNDRMRVRSPLTNPASLNAGCGTAHPQGGVHGLVDLPDGEVIYARNSSASVSQHPLQMPSAPAWSGWNQTNLTTRWEHQGYMPEYDARAGDIFVHGTVEGRVTVAAENDVIVVHDLEYSDVSEESTDLVGLISGNNVMVYHPIETTRRQTRSCFGNNCGSWGNTTTFRNNAALFGANIPPFSLIGGAGMPATPDIWEQANIHAAVLALNRSFWVQNYQYGDRLSDLHVYGAIAQKFRGPVATAGGTGYDKDYVYDERLRFLSPPYFLSPTVSPWGRRVWTELQRPPECPTGVEPHESDEYCLPPLD